MKTLKNLKTPVLALIFGLGLVLSQSAFKATSTAQTWVRDANDEWHLLGTVDGYCEGETDNCTGEFENGVNPNEPISENPTTYPQPTNTTPGTFFIL